MNGKVWTEAEDNIIREKYPRYGQCIMEHLPGRTLEATRQRAYQLDVHIEGITKRGPSGSTEKTKDAMAKARTRDINFWENRKSTL